MFKLPQAALAENQRIPKKRLVAAGGFMSRESKILDKISRVDLFATVTKTTTRILPCVDAQHDIQSVIFLRCKLTENTPAFTKVTELLHRAFPNPTVILVEAGDSFAISAVITRKNRAERGKVVIEHSACTPLFDPKTAAVKPFLAVLNFANLPQSDLRDYLDGIVWNLELSQAIPLVGFFPAATKTSRVPLLELIGKAELLGNRIKSVSAQLRDRDLDLNQHFRLREQGKQLQREQEAVAKRIKELSGGRG